MREEAQLSEADNSGNQGSTVKKYPNLATMTETEQDEYWAEGLDPADVKKIQEEMKDLKKSESKAMPSKGGVGAQAEEGGLGLSDHNSASAPVEIPKGVSEMSSEEDKIDASLIIKKGTKVLEATGGTAKKTIPQVEATSSQGLNSPPSIPNSQGSITDGIDNVSLNHRVEGDVNVKQTEKGAEDAGVRPLSTPPTGFNWPKWPTRGS